MGLRPTQDDEKRIGPATTLSLPLPSPCHPDRSEAKRRDLRFYGPFLDMFFDGAVVTFFDFRAKGAAYRRPHHPDDHPGPWQRFSPFQRPFPFCHPERTRISCFTVLTRDHLC